MLFEWAALSGTVLPDDPSLIPPGKKVIVASSRGGVYTDGLQKPFDFQETYLRAVFGILGLTDISFIRAEGVSMGPEAAPKCDAIGREPINGNPRIPGVTTGQ